MYDTPLKRVVDSAYKRAGVRRRRRRYVVRGRDDKKKSEVKEKKINRKRRHHIPCRPHCGAPQTLGAPDAEPWERDRVSFLFFSLSPPTPAASSRIPRNVPPRDGSGSADGGAAAAGSIPKTHGRCCCASSSLSSLPPPHYFLLLHSAAVTARDMGGRKS